MRAFRLPTLLTALGLAGCAPWQSSAPVTPSSYAQARDVMPRTLGRLRRLVLVELDRAAPKACDAGTDGEVTLTVPDAETREILVERKGYELVDPAPDAGHPWLDDGAVQALAQDMRRAEGAGDALQLAAPLRAWLDRLRAEHQVDALFVVQVESTCGNALGPLRGALAIVSLGTSELTKNPELRRLETLYVAAAFESASGRLVWRNEVGHGAKALDAFRQLRGATAGPSPLERLLEPVEPAVPKILTR